MNVYIWNKVISLIVPITVIAVVGWLVVKPDSWTLLLVIVSLLGYTHYILGAYYQHQAWRRRGKYRHFLWVFLLLTALSVGIVMLAIVDNLLWLVAFLTIPYFVWHGYENEQTLFIRSTGQHLSPWLLCGIGVVVVGATMDAFRHASANFTNGLTFAHDLIPKFSNELLFLEKYLFIAGSILMAAGTAMIMVATYKNTTRANIFWTIASSGLLIWFLVANPLPYVWLFVLLLSYHFLTWGIHYGIIFWPQERRFTTYILAHGAIVVVVILVSGLFTYSGSPYSLGLLNSEFFIAATIVHITTSFLNDQWLQRLSRLS